MKDKAMIQLGGLWEQTDKNGNTYFSGSMGQGRLVMFKNSFKKENKHPDYVLYITEKTKKEAPIKAESTEENQTKQEEDTAWLDS